MTSILWPPKDQLKLIGTRIDRADGPAKSSGAAKYSLDINRPGLLYGKILGASILAPHAGELIHVWCLAITQGLGVKALSDMIAPYPTLGEASKRAAGSYFLPKLFSDRTKKVVRFLAKFG